MKAAKCLCFVFLLFCFSGTQLLSAKNNFTSVNSGDSIPFKNILRINFITGMTYSPHIDFEHRMNQHWGWGVSVMARPAFDFGISRYSRVSENPDAQDEGFGIFSDLNLYASSYKESRGRYWSFTFRGGYRHLVGNKITVGTETSAFYYGKLDRKRDDIVSDLRMSYVIPFRGGNGLFDLFVSGGARTSFYQTRFFNEYGTAPLANQPVRVRTGMKSFPANGCYVLPEYNAGLEIGFGW